MSLTFQGEHLAWKQRIRREYAHAPFSPAKPVTIKTQRRFSLPTPKAKP